MGGCMKNRMFDKDINFYNSNSTKWNYTDKIFGKNNLIPMWIADMDFAIPKETMKAMLKRVNQGVFGYTRISEEYVFSIQLWLQKKRNLNVDSSWIVCTAGVISAVKNLIYTITQKGDKVLIQTPVYHHFVTAILETERKPIFNKLILQNDVYCMDFIDSELKFKNGVKVMLLCNPHNPVGRVWKKEELEKLGELCEKYSVMIISDEIHADIIFKGNSFVSIRNIESINKNHVFICTSVSKTFNLAGLAAGIVIISDNNILIEFKKEMNKNGANISNIFGLLASQVSVQEGEKWYLSLMEYLQRNLDAMEIFIKEEVPLLKLIRPEGTYLLWIDCRKLHDHIDSAVFFTNLAGVALSDGRQFGNGGEGFQRMNIACSKSRLQEAMMRIKEAYDRLNL